VDHSLLTGTPGIIASSAQGAGNQTPLGSNFGVSGMQMTNWVGSDAPTTPSGWVARATETFMIAGLAPNPPWSQTAPFTVVANFNGAGGGNAGEVDFGGTASLVYNGRTWAGDQSSSVVMSNVSQYTSIDVLVRAATATETFYLGHSYSRMDSELEFSIWRNSSMAHPPSWPRLPAQSILRMFSASKLSERSSP
jgi:hypothetical protein